MRLQAYSVTTQLRIFAGGPAASAGHTDTQFLEAQCVAADPAAVGTTSLRHASTVTHDWPAGVEKPIIDYYKTNIDYEKNRV